MSGTSADGVDVAVVDIGGKSVDLVAFDTFGYPPRLRRKIFELFDPGAARIEDISHLNFVIGEVFADALIKLSKTTGISLGSIDLTGSHGQTIYHDPVGKRFRGRRTRSTLQIGEPSVLAERTGITTVADFRPGDIAAGGQGAPLVPYADYVLFGDKHKTRAIQNIGGIANVTYLPAGCGIGEVIAFDTGPGNMMIDRVVYRLSKGRRRYDAGGELAGRGEINKSLLGELMRHKFLRKPPPKSTGREEFGIQFSDATYDRAIEAAVDPLDMLATVTAFTAKSISHAYRQFLPKMPQEVILCGGGARNRTLVTMLKDELASAEVMSTDDFGISIDAKEAVSFAVLAYATLRGLANNVPSATGADRPVVLGKIVVGAQ